MRTQNPSRRVPWHLRDPAEHHIAMERHLATLQRREREVRLAERLRGEQEQRKEVASQ